MLEDGTTEYAGEVTADGEELVLLKGGRGGLGNWHFKTSTNQAPLTRSLARIVRRELSFSN